MKRSDFPPTFHLGYVFTCRPAEDVTLIPVDVLEAFLELEAAVRSHKCEDFLPYSARRPWQIKMALGKLEKFSK